MASGNPMAVYDPKSKRIIVVFGLKNLRQPGGCSPGDGVFLVHDDGTDGIVSNYFIFFSFTDTILKIILCY
jgi:hypothetical protein